MSETKPIPPTSSVTALRIPMIKKGEYDLWSMKMRQYIAITDHILWDIITNGDQATTDPASSHLLSFHDATNAKTLWTAIKARFGGNEASKKMQKNLLKQQFETFTIGSREELDSAYESYGFEDSNSKALVATDNNEDIDWTKEFDAEPVTLAMMALTEVEQDDWSMEFDAEHVHFGHKSYKKLLESYQTERDNFQKLGTEILGYQMSLESLEVILKTHEKNEYAWGDKYEQMEYDLKIKDLKLEEKQKELDQALKERDDFKDWGCGLVVGTPHRPQRPKKIVKSIWVKKGSMFESQAVLPQTVKKSAMINPKQTWRPKGNYLDSVNRDNGSYTLKQFEYGNPEEDLKDYAIIDSGCSGSMTGDKDKLSDFKEFKGGYVAFGNDSKGGRISGKGTIKTSCLDFEKVSYVEELKFNLLSVSQICDKKHNVLFTDKECLILSPKFKFVDEDLVILRAPRKNDVYSLDLKNIIPSGGVTCLVAKATNDEVVLWHRRLGHVNLKNINKLVQGNLVKGLPSKTFKIDHSCLACNKGKQHRASCKKVKERTIREPLELLHMDLFGPVSVESINKKKYCLVVTDDCSKFSWVFFLAYKDETYDMLHDLIVGLENRLRHKVKTIRCDHGTEFKNQLMNEFCAKKGIKREYSIARTPQQNGVAERKNRTLIEAARTMLADSLLPIQFWAEAVNTACYVLNRVLVTKPQMKTPYEILMGRSPNISFMRPFGCPLTILNTLDHLGKFDGKSEEGYLLGYSTNSKGFRVYNRVTRKVQDCLHVNFLENQKGKGPDWMFDLDLLTPSMNYIPVRKENYADSGDKVSTLDDVEDLDDQQFIVHTAQPMHPEERTAAKEVPLSSEEQALHDELMNLMHQESLAKAHNDDQRIAFEEEKRRISIAKGKEHVNSTFIQYCNTPPSKKVSQALADESWVEAMQEELLQFKLQEMDVKSAFLYGNITEEVYVKQPPGFEDPAHPNKVYRVVKALYGRYQAPEAMIEGDICRYRYMLEDIILGSTKSSMVKDFEDLLQKRNSRRGERGKVGWREHTPFEAQSLGKKFEEGEDVDVHILLDFKVTPKGFSSTCSFTVRGTMLGTTMREDQLIRRMVSSWKKTSFLAMQETNNCGISSTESKNLFTHKGFVWQDITFGGKIGDDVTISIVEGRIPFKEFDVRRDSFEVEGLSLHNIELDFFLCASTATSIQSTACLRRVLLSNKYCSTFAFHTHVPLQVQGMYLQGTVNIQRDCWTPRVINFSKQKRRRKEAKEESGLQSNWRNKEKDFVEEHNVLERNHEGFWLKKTEKDDMEPQQIRAWKTMMRRLLEQIQAEWVAEEEE
ncbi:putative ribonuclease H-like domain-containing protein [Tanacetum coccineum]